MNKEILYKGVNTTPSANMSVDGDTSMLYNLIPEDNAIKPIMPPKELAHFDNLRQVFIHKNNFTHYIVIQQQGDNVVSLSCYDSQWKPIQLNFIQVKGYKQISAIGNVLIISKQDEMRYVIFREGRYRDIGSQIPNIDMSFRLTGSVYAHEYNNCGLTEGDRKSDLDGRYRIVVEKEFEINGKLRQGDYSDYIYFDETLVLKKGKLYLFSRKMKSDIVFFYLCVEGKNPDGKYQLLADFSGDAKVMPKEDFSNIRMRIRSRSNNLTYATNRINVKEAEGKKEDYSAKRIITYSKENYDIAMAVMNKYVVDYATKRGRFIYPFFVRYAIKLYDGSYVNLSNPILMIPNSGYAPFLSYDFVLNKCNVTAYAFIADLEYKIKNAISGEWEGIVEGVDIFASQPIYPYLQGKNFDATKPLFSYKIKNEDINEFEDLSYGYIECSFEGRMITDGCARTSLCHVLEHCFDFGNLDNKTEWDVLQVAKDGNVKKKIVKTSNFYHIHSIKFKDIATETDNSVACPVTIEDGALLSLVDRPALDDDIIKSRTITNATTCVYNNRVHAFNLAFKLPEPKGVALCNNYISQNDTEAEKNKYEMLAFIKKGNMTKVARKPVWGFQRVFPWFFYPDNDAYKAVVLSHEHKDAAVFTLTKHPLLNGAYWLDLEAVQKEGVPVEGDYEMYNKFQNDDTIESGQTIYVSETNNPFSFRSVNTVNVGCNKIYALSSAAKALSQGQFGQFPLYAFTDNGVWALQTNNTGSYSARQPVTRDVCVNAESITQLDSAVLFSTDRGIMLLEGATATCISNAIFGVNTVPITALPQFKHLYAHANLSSSATVPQITDIHDMQYLYDYIHQRIIAYVQSSPVAFVFSIKSKQWGMMQSNFKRSINAYPDTMAITNGNHVITLSDMSYERQLDYIGTQLLVTRPLNVDAQNIFKTVNTVIQRGLFKKGNVMQVLFASNDLLYWVIVWSSTNQYLRGFSGTPYKYYRLALLTTLHANECVTGATVQFLPKLTNQPR